MHCFFSSCFFQILGLHIISELRTLVNKMMPSGILKPMPLIFNYHPLKCWVSYLGFSFYRIIQRHSPLLDYFSSYELNSLLVYACLRVSKQNCRKFLMRIHWVLLCFVLIRVKSYFLSVDFQYWAISANSIKQFIKTAYSIKYSVTLVDGILC